MKRIWMTLLVMAAALAVAPPAQADQYGGTSGNGFNLQAVTVVVTGGKGDPVSGGSVSVSVPPVCWWAPFNVANYGYFDVDPSAPDAMAQWIKANEEATTISFQFADLTHPTSAYLEGHTGPDWTWYQLESAPGVNCADEGFAETRGSVPGSDGDPVTLAVGYAAFPTGTPPPPPVVDIDDVVREVWDAASAEVEAPDLDRNPKAVVGGGAALVNLPTWFWVQNVQGALAGDGEIHLDISIPGTPVQASLDASTSGVQVTSPAGAVACSVDQATTTWSSDATESSACTFPFSRANRTGWPVTAQTTWTGSWEGTDRNGPTGGNLDALTTSATSNVPVVESQTLVTDVD